MTIRALVFDFDGTILDTETPEFSSWRDLYTRFGATLEPAVWGVGVGTWDAFDPHAHLEGLTGRALDRAELTLEHRARVLGLIEAEVPLPGVVALLEEARTAGLRLAVASSSERAWVSGWLERHDLAGNFECLRTRDDVTRVKPDPELFLAAAECLGLPPAECVAFEDSPNGMKAALAAGMRVVAVPNAVTRDLAMPEGVLLVSSLAEQPLALLLERLEPTEASVSSGL